VGNLLGDFRRGEPVASYAPELRAGLRNHHCVDACTDRHPEVVRARRLFSPARRRFAGIALDVLFDHFLIRHWAMFNDCSLDVFLESAHGDLERGRGLMPAPMRRRVDMMREQDWLRAYADLENVGRALDRIAGRIRFSNAFAGVIEEIILHRQSLEASFLAFFPDLCRHVECRAIETAPVI
jgi:acyl carrier protein phosphodiesterase